MGNKTNTEINGHKYFRVRLLIGYDSDGKKILKTFYGKSKSEAESKREAYKQDMKNGMDVTAIEQTLNDAFREWLIGVIMPSGIKISTFETYETIYRLHIKDSDIGIKKVKELKTPMIQAYLNKLYNGGKNYTLLLKLTKLLKRFFNYQIELDIILKNPCNNVKVPGQINYVKEKNIEEVAVYSLEERDKILKYLYEINDKIAGMAYLSFSLGMRQGEILALKWKDVDLKNRTIKIKQSLRYTNDYDEEGNKIGGSMKLTMPKNMQSAREIEYPSSFDDMWEKAREHNLSDMAKAGNSYNNERDLIFTTAKGEPLGKRTVLRHWESALKALNLPYRSFHIIRHTFITQMSLGGVPEPLTQAIVGHKKGSNVTHKIYTHVNKENTKKVLEAYTIDVPII